MWTKSDEEARWLDARTKKKLVEAGQAQAASILAASIISSAGRPHSLDDALRLFEDCRMMMFPTSGEKHEKWRNASIDRITETHQ